MTESIKEYFKSINVRIHSIQLCLDLYGVSKAKTSLEPESL